MTDTKHTPGPWHVGMGPILYGAKGEQIADLCGSLLSVDEALANHALIASAPDLLAERDHLRRTIVSLSTRDKEIVERERQLLATQADLLAALRDIANATPHDGTQPLATKHCERARAALARAGGK